MIRTASAFRVAALVAALSLTAAAPLQAANCDCSRRVGLCQAEASYDGARLSFTSQTVQCSRISFSVNDQEASITIQQGEGSARFAAPGAARDVPVSVDACFVCDVVETRP